MKCPEVLIAFRSPDRAASVNVEDVDSFGIDLVPLRGVGSHTPMRGDRPAGRSLMISIST